MLIYLVVILEITEVRKPSVRSLVFDCQFLLPLLKVPRLMFKNHYSFLCTSVGDYTKAFSSHSVCYEVSCECLINTQSKQNNVPPALPGKLSPTGNPVIQ